MSARGMEEISRDVGRDGVVDEDVDTVGDVGAPALGEDVDVDALPVKLPSKLDHVERVLWSTGHLSPSDERVNCE